MTGGEHLPLTAACSNLSCWGQGHHLPPQGCCASQPPPRLKQGLPFPRLLVVWCPSQGCWLLCISRHFQGLINGSRSIPQQPFPRLVCCSCCSWGLSFLPWEAAPAVPQVGTSAGEGSSAFFSGWADEVASVSTFVAGFPLLLCLFFPKQPQISPLPFPRPLPPLPLAASFLLFWLPFAMLPNAFPSIGGKMGHHSRGSSIALPPSWPSLLRTWFQPQPTSICCCTYPIPSLLQ